MDDIIYLTKQVEENIEFLVKLFASCDSTSVIIRANPGMGKKVLVREAAKRANVKPIYLNPFLHTDDNSAVRCLASELGVETKPSNHEMIEAIVKRKGFDHSKIVIVLHHFDEFCRRGQSLLYSLTYMTQHGINICLVGITISLVSIENLEKRVRSRLNALFYEVKPPYQNVEEYLQFASLFLNGYEIKGILKEHLEYIYMVGDQSVSQLKRYLGQFISFQKKSGKMIIEKPTDESITGLTEIDMNFFEERFRSLTKRQQEILTVAVSYCHRRGHLEFSLHDLVEFKDANNLIHANDRSAIMDASILGMLRFFKPIKPREPVLWGSMFTLCVTYEEFVNMMMKNKELRSIRTDKLWQRLK